MFAAFSHPEYRPSYHEFGERPLSDSCWSIQTGPDGRVYVACCVEHTGGQTATVVRYDKPRDRLEYLFDMDEVTGDLRDSGRATQCKIHYSFVPDPEHDLLYCATHLSGPPKGETSYNPWAAWHDPVRAFRGSYLVAYDTRRERVADVHLMIPKEGCRCLAIDLARRRLYALTYPRDHFVVYDLATHQLADKGRLGSVNSQCLIADRKGRIYTFVDTGRMVRYDPDTDRLDAPAHTFAHEPCQSPWHGVLYDAVADPSDGAIYMVPWKSRPHLMRFYPDDGPDGRLEDLGAITQATDPHRPVSMNVNHVGGLVFGRDGCLYYVKAAWDPALAWPRRIASPDDSRAVLCRMNPLSCEHEELCTLGAGAGLHHYVSRAARDPDGDFYFGKIMAQPAGFYRVEVGAVEAVRPNDAWLRYWG